MAQPVKLSNELVLDARTTGERMQRSIAGQVELWARLGRAVEGLLTADRTAALTASAPTADILQRLDLVDTPEGRQRVKDYLASQPFPRYFAYPEDKNLLIREESDGRRIVGRFVNREFIEAPQKATAKPSKKTVAA